MKDKNWSLQDMTRRFLYLAFVGLSLVVRTLCAEEPAIQRYLQLYRDYPGAFSPKGDWQQGEVEIIDDYAKMVEVQNAVKQRLLKKGLSEKEAIDRSRVGVIHEDAYWMWIRDAVIFPDGF